MEQQRKNANCDTSSIGISILIQELLSEIDFQERRWRMNDNACKIKAKLKILVENPEFILSIIDKTPDELTNAVCEIILLNSNC